MNRQVKGKYLIMQTIISGIFILYVIIGTRHSKKAALYMIILLFFTFAAAV
jgi:hypothetical protein